MVSIGMTKEGLGCDRAGKIVKMVNRQAEAGPRGVSTNNLGVIEPAENLCGAFGPCFLFFSLRGLDLFGLKLRYYLFKD